MNQFAGVFALPDPPAALARLGVEPAWTGERLAFGHAPVCTDRTGSVVVAGDVTLDNRDELRLSLGTPAASGGALLAELYLRDGICALEHARGMYAAAIWDGRTGTVTLVRDGVGARTLYYTTDGQGWWFSARMNVLRRAPSVSGDLSLTALRNYLTCAFVPGEETMLRDVRELRPGTALVLPQGRVVRVWEPIERPPSRAEPIETHAARLRPLLEDTVRVRMPSIGPVGVFLSGGLDSSLVTALAARMADPGEVHTYAIHFGRDLPNELTFSGMVAEHCGTRHHVVELPGRLIRDTLTETMAALDDPIGDPLTVPNLLLGRAAARDVGTVLNGEGGDPCFGGPKNGPMLLHELYGATGSREEAYFRSYQKCYDDLTNLLTLDVQSALFKAAPQDAVLAPFLRGGENDAMPSTAQADPRPPMSDYLNQLMHINVRLKGADHILTKVNNLTCAAGLVGRSPLFDQRIVQASFEIPAAYKLEGANEKAVLKRAVADLLPEPILTRPKSGMLVPVQRWFQDDLRRYARGLLLDRRARIRPYLNQSQIHDWLDYRGILWPRHGVKLWLVLTLETWLRAHE
jgi:asparagine synthase (glutamine-hydrolysing)